MLRKNRWGSFVPLRENALAVRAVRRIVRAHERGKKPPFDVLLITGDVGSGKTHLVRELAQRVRHAVTAPARDLSRGFESDVWDAVPLLVVEDVQHLSANSAERFALLLDSRTSRRLVTVVTAGDVLADVPAITSRVRSRLTGGLLVAIHPLSPASRLTLVRIKSRENGWKLTRVEILELADRVTGGTRELLGTAAQWAAERRKAGPGARPRTRPPVTDEHSFAPVVKKVAKAFGVTEAEMRGPSQLPKLTTARHVAILLGFEQLNLTYRRIGDYLGRSGSSVASASVNLRWKMIRSPELTATVKRLEDDCRADVRKLVAHASRDEH